MLNFSYKKGILRLGNYYGKPAVCIRAEKVQNLSPDKLANRVIDFYRKNIGSGTKYIYFYGSDPFLFPDHELGVLFHRLQMENFKLIVETPIEVNSSLYTLVDDLIQTGTILDLLSNYVSFKNHVLILYDKEQETKLDVNNIRKVRGNLGEIFIRPLKAYQYKKVEELICKTKLLYLSENPLIMKD